MLLANIVEIWQDRGLMTAVTMFGAIAFGGCLPGGNRHRLCSLELVLAGFTYSGDAERIRRADIA